MYFVHETEDFGQVLKKHDCFVCENGIINVVLTRKLDGYDDPDESSFDFMVAYARACL